MLPMLIAASLFANVTPIAARQTPERVGLEGAWRLTQSDRKLSLSAKVPGMVDTDLLAAGKIPDPFYRDNETAVQWVGEVPWTYSRSFTLTTQFLKHRQIRLRCEGLDTLAQIRVNGSLVANTDNMFRTWEFNVLPLLHPGINRIDISFSPVEPYLKDHEIQAAFPGKPIQGWGYIRKPPFQQGWDFAPKLITCGIWKGIGLVGWDQARLTDVAIVQNHSSTGKVTLNVAVAADTSVPTIAHTTVLFQGHPVASSDSPLAGGKSSATIPVPQPQRWWPAGMGSQNLYDVCVDLRNSKGTTVDSTDRHIGLRTITWIQKTAQHPLMLEVNGRPFFAKGTNWVPPDSLITRTTAAKERQLVDNVVGANMNMMRLWGGGYYDDDAFYDECDKKGLLLWSEFKFADAPYPAFDPAWVANVKAEAQDNVRRLRDHPSLVVWSGNNEVIGFVRDTTSNSGMAREDYDLLFHHVLADTVHELDPGSVYTPGSPESGDEHDWSVWHGGAPFDSYLSVHGFVSEFGFQAFPSPKSVDAFTAPEDRDSVMSPIMHFHQRNWGDGNQIILNTFRRYYLKPKDFDSTLWLSQIQQADGVLTGVENWRRDWPNSTGSLVWQYNDCWPSVSWSMVDYYGRPKALYYRLRHAYAPVMLSGITDHKLDTAELWICNDRRNSLRGRLDWKLMRLNGSVVTKGSQNVAIAAGTSATRAIKLSEAAAIEKEGAANVVVWAELTVPNEPVSSAVLTFVRPKDLNLTQPDFRTSVTQTGSTYRVTISDLHPALWTWLDLAGIDATFSDNFIALGPGEPQTIVVQPSAKTSLTQVLKALRVRSLYDTYLPGTVGTPVTKAAPDGSILATADDADITGNAAIVESGTPDNIGDWADVHDYAQWTVTGAKPGTYSVTMNISCPPGVEGSKFVLDIAGKQLNGTVPSTPGWTSYADMSLGNVTISQAGTIKITLTPTSMATDRIMNLRTITLKPVQGP